MATIDFENDKILNRTTPMISKIKLGDTVYYVRDAELEEIVAAFGTAVQKNVDANVAKNGTGLVTGDAVANYVEGQITDLAGAMHFKGGYTAKPAVDAFAAGDVIVITAGDDVGKEFVLLESGDPAVKSWVELGNENAYVLKTTTIAGVDLQDSITKAELQSALELKALAYWSAAEVKVTTADGIAQFSTGAAGEYDVTSTAVAVPATYSALDVTPAGTVALTAETAAAVAYDKVKPAVAIAAVALQEGETATYTPAGNITLPTINMTHATDTKESVATVTDAGTAYTITEGSATQGTVTRAEKLVASETVNNETLEFSKEYVVSNVGDITYVAPTISGALPTFGTKQVVTAVGADTAAFNGDASFAGTGVKLSGTASTESANATVTQPTFSAEFTGTDKSVTPAVATTVNAAGTDAKVIVASENITPTLNKSEKTIAVIEHVEAGA